MLETRSPMRVDHALVTRFRDLSRSTVRKNQVDLLHGYRDFKWPMLALHANTELGPARHALSQIAVGGEMVVYPPFAEKSPSKE